MRPLPAHCPPTACLLGADSDCSWPWHLWGNDSHVETATASTPQSRAGQAGRVRNHARRVELGPRGSEVLT